MILRSATHAVFATPELALMLFALVPRRDLLQCIRVCKAWHQHAESFLWRHFRPESVNGAKLPPQATKALVRNLPRIRSVELKCYEYRIVSQLALRLKPGISARVASSLCTNLRRLKLECHFNFRHFKLPPLIKLLNHNLRLTHLTLPFAALTMDNTISTAIPNLRCLRHLTLESAKMCSKSSNPYIGLWTIPFLLQACLPLPELTELHLDFEMIWHRSISNDTDNSELESIIKKAATARFMENPTASKIKSLRLPTCSKGGRNPLPIPFMRSGLLDFETCTIPWFPEDSSPQEVEQVVREHCPRLRHVTCQSWEDTGDGRLTRAFLRGCSGIQTFVSDSFSDRTPIPDDQGFVIAYEPRLIISALVSRHHLTLENFELTECCHVSSKDLQAILARCKLLKRFWVEYLRLTSEPGIDFTDVSNADWVCMGLRELSLRLNRDLNAEGALSPDQLAQAVKRIYTQIGRLHALERLVLDIRSSDKREQDTHYSWDLTLSRGWLGEMAGLKCLKMIQLESDLWSRMGQAEVDFMHDHWPLLREIRFYNYKRLYWFNAVRWRWPSEKRRPDAWLASDVRLWTSIGLT